MEHRYFEKDVDQRMASIDEKFVSIQLTMQKFLQEIRERDNQRHAERQAVNARIDATLADIRDDFRKHLPKLTP
jgi:DNA polymerase I-like protein with 3'-5' exonuclease and polymerase domains